MGVGDVSGGGEKYHFQKRGGGNVIFGPKYRLLMSPQNDQNFKFLCELRNNIEIIIKPSSLAFIGLIPKTNRTKKSTNVPLKMGAVDDGLGNVTFSYFHSANVHQAN